MAHNYCPYELIFGKTCNLPKHFNSTDRIEPIYNIEDYAKESKYRLEVAYNRARIMLEEQKKKNKELYDLKLNDISISIGDKVLLKNETGHKLDFKYTGLYTVVKIEERDNIVISNDKKKPQTVHKDR
ncbi:hypothetical protein HUN27_25735, partial [Agrobacterium tumefaciens]|nr:hypothetical protein [Agrobacterium tumefaciens]